VLALLAAILTPFSFSPEDPFAAGSHRGVDIRAAAARAPCAGRVAFAGRTPAGRAVTIRCGRWRVTLLPLAELATRRGASVATGASLGRTAPGHPGLHIGVRRAGDPWGYVDPLAALPHLRAGPAGAPPLVAPPRAARPRGAPPPSDPPRGAPRAAPRPRGSPADPIAPRPARLPWTAYLGAGLLAAAVPAVPLARRRRRRVALRAAAVVRPGG
jgi:Peptidase family M23